MIDPAHHLLSFPAPSHSCNFPNANEPAPPDAKGYQSGKPDGRYKGAFMYIGLLGLLGISGRLAYETLA